MQTEHKKTVKNNWNRKKKLLLLVTCIEKWQQRSVDDFHNVY